jgi:hypothetical protein
MQTTPRLYTFPVGLAIAMMLLSVTLHVHGQGNPLAGGQILPGTYTDGSLTLELQGDPGAFSGTLTLQGTQFPLSATAQGNVLTGAFSANGQRFPFRATWTGTELVLESGGSNYRLPRKPSATANPLARPSQPAPAAPARAQTGASLGQPSQAGEFLLQLPAGWTAKDDGSGNVALLPPGLNPQGGVTELYVAMAPGYESLRDPEIVQELEEDYIPQAARQSAQRTTRPFSVNGRSGLVHSWKFQRPDNGQPITLQAYLVESEGEVIEILATVAGDLSEARNQHLQQIAGSIQLNAAAAMVAVPGAMGQQLSVPGSPSNANPAVAPASQTGALSGIQTHPQAPPLVPGQLSDNNPQSLQWLAKLRGMMLSRYDRGGGDLSGGWTSSEKMFLYPDGRFEYSTSNQFTVDTGGAFGSGSGRDAKAGTWRILTANGTSFLALVYQGSNTEEYAELDFRENKTFLDGSRVLVTPPQ